jgi:hypothetical protein
MIASLRIARLFSPSLAVTLLIASCPVLGQGPDTDADGIPDAVEARLGMDAALKDTLEVLYDDGAKGGTDRDCGAELVPHGDFTRISFCRVARMRYLWRIEFAADVPWPMASHDAIILYVDADNDPDTGRRDKEWARGCDMMLRPGGVEMHGWPGAVKSASCADGKALYMVADIALHQQAGQSLYRMTFLFQDTRDGHEQNRDSTPWITVKVAGESRRPRVAVAEQHPLYHPPETISYVAARPLFDAPQPRAEVTFITSWPTKARVQYGLTPNYGFEVRTDTAAANHRLYIQNLEEGREYHYRITAAGFEAEVASDDASFSLLRPKPVRGTAKRSRVKLTAENSADVPAPGRHFREARDRNRTSNLAWGGHSCPPGRGASATARGSESHRHARPRGGQPALPVHRPLPLLRRQRPRQAAAYRRE